MSNFTRCDPDVEANDEKPLHSQQRIELVRTNLRHMMDEGPEHFSFTFLPGDERSTTDDSYDDPGSFLVRWSIEYARPSRMGHRPRWWEIKFYAKVSGGATAAIRVVAGRWAMVSDPPVGVELEAEATGITSATGEAKTVTLELEPESLSHSTIGRAAGDPPEDYDTILMAMEGRITAGAGTLTLMAVAGRGRNPS